MFYVAVGLSPDMRCVTVTETECFSVPHNAETLSPD